MLKTNLGVISKGDDIFYNRNYGAKWHGPSIVVRCDGKQILVRHGGTHHRAHTYRLYRRPVGESDEPTESTDSQGLVDIETDEQLPQR